MAFLKRPVAKITTVVCIEKLINFAFRIFCAEDADNLPWKRKTIKQSVTLYAYYFIITYFKKITAAVTNVNCNSGTITSCWWHHASDGRDCFMMILCCIYDSPVDRLLFMNTINHSYYIYCGKSIVSIDYIHICSKTAENSRFRDGNLWRGNICADRKIISVYFWL